MNSIRSSSSDVSQSTRLVPPTMPAQRPGRDPSLNGLGIDLGSSPLGPQAQPAASLWGPRPAHPVRVPSTQRHYAHPAGWPQTAFGHNAPLSILPETILRGVERMSTLQISADGRFAHTIGESDNAVRIIDLICSPPAVVGYRELAAAPVHSRFSASSDALGVATEEGDIWICPLYPELGTPTYVANRNLNVIDFNFSADLQRWAAVVRDDTGDYQELVAGRTDEGHMASLELPEGIFAERMMFMGDDIAIMYAHRLELCRLHLGENFLPHLTPQRAFNSADETLSITRLNSGATRTLAFAGDLLRVYAGQPSHPFASVCFETRASDGYEVETATLSPNGQFMAAQYRKPGESSMPMLVVNLLAHTGSNGVLTYPFYELPEARSPFRQRVTFSPDSARMVLTPVVSHDMRTPTYGDFLTYDLRAMRVPPCREAFHAEPGAAPGSWHVHPPVSVAFTPDGLQMLTASTHGLVQRRLVGTPTWNAQVTSCADGAGAHMALRGQGVL